MRGKVVSFRRFLARRRQRQWQLAALGNWFEDYRRLWGASLDRLGDYLGLLKQKGTEMDDLKITAPVGEPIVIITRTLNAPRALVWKALSEPEHAVRWWGPHGHKNRVLEFAWRVGGKWKIESTMPEGVIVFFGEYREIKKPEKVTQTFSFDQLPEGVYSVDTVVLEDQGDKTVYRASSIFPDIASRDGMMASGMEVGVREGFERLDQMLEEFKAHA